MSNQSTDQQNGLWPAFPGLAEYADGLTKRELIAAMCMQKGMATEGNGAPNLDYYRRAAECAVIAADALLAALDRSHE